MDYRRKWLGIALILVMLFALTGGLFASEFPNSLEWDGQGADKPSCDKIGESPERTEDGWIHWIVTGASGVTEAELVLGGSGSGTYDPTKYGPVVEFFTPYFDVDTLTATLHYDGTLGGTSQFTISDYCPGVKKAELAVTAKLDLVWTREVKWDIDKSVYPDKWHLFKGDTGTSEYTVAVTKVKDVTENYLEWEVCVENIGPAEAKNVILNAGLYEDGILVKALLTDESLGDIAKGDKECKDGKEENFPFKEGSKYQVKATATLDNGDPADGMSPEKTANLDLDGYPEINVTDTNSGAGPWGPLTESKTFTYKRTFTCDTYKNDNYAEKKNGFYRYHNTATIEETGQSDKAHVDVYCYKLKMKKTAETTFDREHKWDIDKSVITEKGYTIGENDVPKIWLYIDGRGDEKATWKVCVTYDGYIDSKWAVKGKITIKNPAPIPATINSVEDFISNVGKIDIDWDGEPFTIGPGETKTFYYSKDLPDGTKRNNKAIAVQQNFDYTYDKYNEEGTLEAAKAGTSKYTAKAKIIFGDPENEKYKVITVKDASDLLGEKQLGTLDAADFDKGEFYCFEYEKVFAYKDYKKLEKCGAFTYNNKATIVETDQSASALLKVNVQCFIYESAWAKGDPNVPFCDYFANWGWTNPIGPGEYTWDLWAGAAKCDTSKGEKVGTVKAVYGADGYVKVTFQLYSDYDLKSTKVYADYDKFPKLRNGRYTVAPGQYYNASPFNGSQVYVIAHAVVGLPDPNFGPTP